MTTIPTREVAYEMGKTNGLFETTTAPQGWETWDPLTKDSYLQGHRVGYEEALKLKKEH